MGLQNCGSFNLGNFEISTWEFWDKMTFASVDPMAKNRKYYKGESGGLPRVRAVISFVIRVYPWFICGPKVFQLCINQLVVWFVQVCVSN